MPEALRHIEKMLDKWDGALPPLGGPKTINRAIHCWLHNKKCEAGNLGTDGKKLFSYGHYIGETKESGEKVVHNYTAGGLGYLSQTTSTHVGRAMRMKVMLDNLVQDPLDDTPTQAQNCHHDGASKGDGIDAVFT